MGLRIGYDNCMEPEEPVNRPPKPDVVQQLILDLLEGGPLCAQDLHSEVVRECKQQRLSTYTFSTHTEYSKKRLTNAGLLRKFRHKLNVFNYLPGQLPEHLRGGYIADLTNRLMLCDWLEEQGRTELASRWRKTCEPYKSKKRSKK